MIKFFLLMALAQHPVTAFNYRESSPPSLFHYRSAIADEFPPGNLSNPAFIPLWNSLYITTAYSKPYMLEDLNAYNAYSGIAENEFGFQAAAGGFGIDEYQEQTFEGNMGIRPFHFFSAGCGITWYRLAISTDELTYHRNLMDFRMGLLLMPVEWIKVSYLQENIRSLFESKRRDILNPDWSAGVSLKAARGFALTWNLNRDYYSYINSFSVSANLLPFLGFRAGYSRETSACAFAVIIAYKMMHLSYGMQFHSYLGATHSIALTMRNENCALEEIHYTDILPGKNSKFHNARRIDINSCSESDLESIPVLTGEMAERILKYRRMIGPLSEKSLYQIGLSSGQVAELQDFTTGLVPDDDEKQKNFRFAGNRNGHSKRPPGYPPERRKEVFTRLLSAGISAGTAIRVADLMKNKSKPEILEEVRKMPDLPVQVKQSIVAACESLL